MQIQNLPPLTHTIPDTTDSHRLGDSWLRNTHFHTHTSYIPRHTWLCPRWTHSSETPSDVSEVHIHLQARTQTHADSLHTGASIHANPEIAPARRAQTGSPPRCSPCLFHKENRRGPCTLTFTWGSDAHPGDSHRHGTHSHVHRSRDTSRAHSNVWPVASANENQRLTNQGP